MILYLVVVLLILLYIHYKRTYSYWSSRNVSGPLALPFMGTLPWLLIFKENRELDFYFFKKYSKIFGEYMGQVPLLVISDPKLAKQILVTDFHIFNQAQKLPIKPKFFENSLTTLHGPKWKRIRSAVSPIFTTGKLRRTVEHLDLPIQNFFENLDDLIRTNKADKIQIKDLTKGFALDAIGKFVFAVEVNSFKRKHDPFVQNVYRMTTFRQWPFMILQIFPIFIGKHFVNQIFDQKSCIYFSELTNEVLKKRRSNPEIKYKDFLELMLESSNEVSDPEIIAQCLLFFFAGMDTISSALSIILSDIAIHQEVQEKLLIEIDDKLGVKQLTYDNIQELEYLDATVKESLRMTAVVNRLVRHPKEDYKLGNTGLILEKDKPVMISVHNIHHDEDYYPKPFEYCPERFLKKNKQDIQNQLWLPFGDGPRNCVGLRFAELEVKYFIVNLIRKYQIKMAKGCPVPVTYKRGLFLNLAEDLRMNFERRCGNDS